MNSMDFVSGAEAAALGAKSAEVQAVSAYPISPNTPIIENISQMIANGELDARMLHIESEHSAMSAAIGSASVGSRTFTATCSQGLALMHECLYIASGLRLPIVMAVTNRALSAPASIWNDHSDALGSRDSGWIQFWTENCQDVLDHIIISYKIAERASVPTMTNLDGFVLSHLSEKVTVPNQEKVKEFLPQPGGKEPLVLPENPGYHGAVAMPSYYEEFAYERHYRIRKSLKQIKEIYSEFEELFGRKHNLVEEYRCSDAKILLVGMGSVTSTAMNAIDQMREQGLPIGLVKLKVFRPFPQNQLQEVLSNANLVMALDRSVSFGSTGGGLFQELGATLNNLSNNPILVDCILGLGGRDISENTIKKIGKKGKEILKEKKKPREIYWVDARKDVLKNWDVWKGEQYD